MVKVGQVGVGGLLSLAHCLMKSFLSSQLCCGLLVKLIKANRFSV